MQKIVNAEKSDIFDVLAFVAYTASPLTRQDRAARAKSLIDGQFSRKQQAFRDFALSHYVQDGVEELNRWKFGYAAQPAVWCYLRREIQNLGALKKSARCLWDFRMPSGDFHRFTATRGIRSPNFGLKTTK
jgi:hypothetical protein